MGNDIPTYIRFTICISNLALKFTINCGFVFLHYCKILIPMMGINMVLFPITVYVFPTMENIFKYNSIVVKSYTHDGNRHNVISH